MKEYYNASDIQKITGCSKSLAYKIIRQLQDRFSHEYRDAILIQGRIPIWYFDKNMKNKGDGGEND